MRGRLLPIRCLKIAALTLLLGAPLTGGAAAVCPGAPGQLGFDVTVRGFRAPSGHIRVYVYGDDAGAFLQRGRWIRRVELPVSSVEPLRVCMTVDRPGRYAISIRHDVDGNRQRTDWNDGVGFSRNPRLSLGRLRPRLEEVTVSLESGVAPIEVVLNYRYGLQIRPAHSSR